MNNESGDWSLFQESLMQAAIQFGNQRPPNYKHLKINQMRNESSSIIQTVHLDYQRVESQGETDVEPNEQNVDGRLYDQRQSVGPVVVQQAP